MDIKERFYDNLNMLREGVEKGNPNIVKLNASRSAAKKALPHVNKNRYEEALTAVKGTALEKPLKSYLDRAQKHWTKMNVLNNSSRKAKSEEKYNEIRNRANDHQDQAQHHHDKAVEYLKSFSTMNEDYEQVYQSLANQLQGYADKDGKRKGKKKNRINQKWSKMWSNAAESSRKRAVTGMSEEAEQLDELKQSTKDRYVERASGEESLATFGARHSSGKAKEKFQNVARKRRKGLSLALKRKED